MKTLLLRIVAPFFYLLSLMPVRVLYGISDFLMGFYPLIGYRKAVIRQNLRNSFPEKEDAEIEQLMRKTYRNMIDVTLEILKMFTSKPSWANKMIEIRDTGKLKKFADEGRSVIVVLGHMGNWELAGTRINNLGYHQVYAIYHPLVNPLMNKWFVNMRTRQGMKLYTMDQAAFGMIRNRHKLIATGIIGDQVPLSQHEYQTRFLNQETLVFRGAALMARKLNQPLFYLHISRPERGRYLMYPELLFENPAEHSIEELSEKHTCRLEENIRKQPEIWLWSHRRWKRKPVQIPV